MIARIWPHQGWTLRKQSCDYWELDAALGGNWELSERADESEGVSSVRWMFVGSVERPASVVCAC